MIVDLPSSNSSTVNKKLVELRESNGVLARGARKAAPRMDAQIRVGGDAGASEVIVLRGYGALADPEPGAGMVMPLLLPDAPVVAWWPGIPPERPSEDPIGRMAQRRITDAAATSTPMKTLERSARSHVPGDTDLGFVMNQDVGIMKTAQRGLHQPGLKHLALSAEECRVINLHRNLDEWLA